MNKNKDTVAYVPSLDCHWMFDVPLSGPRVSDMHNELLQIIKQVFRVVDGWLQPQNVEYSLLHYGEDIPARMLFETDFPEVETGEFHVNPNDPFRSVVDQLEDKAPDDGPDVLSLFLMNRAATKIKLEHKDEFIDKESADSYSWWLHDGPIDRQPISDPMEVHLRLRRPTTSGGPPLARVIFESFTDIWFEDTKIGQVNRQRLAGVLRRLASVLDQTGAWFYSEQYGEDRIEQLGLDDIFEFG